MKQTPAASTNTTPSNRALIPYPNEIEWLSGFAELTADASITYMNDKAKAVAELLAAQLRPATKYPIPVNAGPDGLIVFDISTDTLLGPEGYTLKNDGKVIRISAPRAAGLFYGAQTVRRLLPPEIFSPNSIPAIQWTIPSVEIRDLPRFGWRGLHLDGSRHFMSKKDVLKFIDVMASLKFNTFHWHLTDDQGWRIEIKKYPKLTEIGSRRAGTLKGHYLPEDEPKEYQDVPHGGFYTQDELREIVAYATERHINIIPEIDIPGHSQAAIAAYPELGCANDPVEVRKTWGISEIILNPEQSTIDFYKDIFVEVMELFPSKFIHIGGDEALKTQWENSLRVQQLCAERGLKNMQDMQNWFIKQFDDFLAANGRRLIGWDEIYESDYELSHDAIIMWWRTKAGATIAERAVRDDHDVIIASDENLYFDYYQADPASEPLAIGGMLPLEKVYNFDPVIQGLTENQTRHILGAQGQLWREYLPETEDVEYMAFPRSCALAELLWLNKDRKDYSHFIERMTVQETCFDLADINYRKMDASK